MFGCAYGHTGNQRHTVRRTLRRKKPDARRLYGRKRGGERVFPYARMHIYAFESSRWESGQTDALSDGTHTAGFTLPFAGAHYAADAAFAVALAVALGADFGKACGALSSFGGVKRRYERAGTLHGAEVIFDYAHHPTELRCALRTADAGGRTLAVFQPHTYSRTASYMADFVEVLGSRKEVVLLPTYAARERGTQGASSADLAAAISENIRNAEFISPFRTMTRGIMSKTTLRALTKSLCSERAIYTTSESVCTGNRGGRGTESPPANAAPLSVR